MNSIFSKKSKVSKTCLDRFVFRDLPVSHQKCSVALPSQVADASTESYDFKFWVECCVKQQNHEVQWQSTNAATTPTERI